MEKKVRIQLPTELLELPEAQRRKALQHIEKALNLDESGHYKTDGDGYAIREVWEQNDESNYNELEERSFNDLATGTWKSMLELFEMLDLEVPIRPIENMEKAFFTDDENPIFIATDYLNIPEFKGSVDRRKVDTLKKAIVDGVKLPPLVVGYHYDIQDGLHRLEAAQELGITHVPCVVGGMEAENVYAAETHYRGLWKSWSEANVKRDGRGRFAAKHGIAVKELAEEAYQNTLEKGGITISLKTGNKRRKGYAYAMNKGTEYKVPLETFSQRDIIKYVKQNEKSLTAVKAHLGTWVSEGFAYIDVSYVGTPDEDTLEKARESQQLAVFDLTTFEEIKTGWVEKSGLVERAPEVKGKKPIFLISTEGKSADEIIEEALEAVKKFNLVYGQAQEALQGEGDE